MNIYLVCNAGMSTSVLVQKMREAAKKRELEAVIEAFSVEILDNKKDSADVILVGPQIRHMIYQINDIVDNACPVGIIDMRHYGMINGEKVLDQALSLIQK
ncbi:MAG: PTS sugar transporter subunit IIB [Clostridiaceae bacterium]